jgi:hypothetical protein
MSLRIAAATAALVLATSTFALAAGPVKFTLHPQNHSGETAAITMTQDGDNIVVAVTTNNGPSDAPQPIHIHKGTCDTLDPKPAYPLTSVQNGTSNTTLTPAQLKGMTLSGLQNGEFAINIHHSTTDGATYYACGNIPKAK